MRFLPVLGFALLLLPGCPSITEVDPPPVADPDRLHQDLPAPDGFTYTENMSRTNPTGTWRVVSQRLNGKNRRVKQTAAWYKETFPVRKWKLQSEKGADTDTVLLTFVKREETCTVTVSTVSPTEVDILLKVNRRE